jgi:hypothetical protein
MSENKFKTRNETPLKHLFDGTNFNVYETNFINLSAGTPSESLLSKCNEIFAESTKHLLVCNTQFYCNEKVIFKIR